MKENVRNWIAEQYSANLFEGCKYIEDVESVLRDLPEINQNLLFEFGIMGLINSSWSYIQERKHNELSL